MRDLLFVAACCCAAVALGCLVGGAGVLVALAVVLVLEFAPEE